VKDTAAIESLDSPLELVWNWSYEIDQLKLDDLYKKAKREQWNADAQLDWSQPVDPAGKILDEQRSPFRSMKFFQALSQTQRDAFNAHNSAHLLSQILHGEQGALMVAGELIAAVPDYEAKLYAASQAMDEARHVEVFERYIRKLDRVYPITRPLRSILTMILETKHWQSKTVGMQVILEGLALGTFVNVRAATSCNLLRDLMTYVTKDEARHVAFGNLYLTEKIRDMHPDDRAEVEDFALDMTKRFIAIRRGPDGMQGFDQVLIDSGIDPVDFVTHLRQEAAEGFRFESAPGSVHSFRGLIMPGIIRAGLVSDRVRPEYEAAQIKLFDDVSLLEELEDRGGIGVGH
jgi:hypothetical protein